jgi:hypothetical protein
VAPYVLDASKAAAMYSDVSGLVEYKLTDLLTPNGAGLKASTADTAARTRAAENFMVDVGCVAQQKVPTSFMSWLQMARDSSRWVR